VGVRIFQVDAFTDRRFAGNPAAVCLFPGTTADSWMQDVAREMNLAATPFVERDGGGFSLRWFSPKVELGLCGHGTLAAAHVLWEEGEAGLDEPLRFETRAGPLPTRRAGEWIEMDFPAEPPKPVEPPPHLLDGIGTEPVWTGRSRLDYLAELESEEAVRGLTPDLDAIARLDARGILVTAAASTPGFDFVVRDFAPQLGIPEDPATGSAQATLAPFWAERLGRDELISYQASARGAVLRGRPQGDRVVIGGRAVTVLRGELA
jgi:predicted PhzF superfamily epimerase YddE/YHI9